MPVRNTVEGVGDGGALEKEKLMLNYCTKCGRPDPTFFQVNESEWQVVVPDELGNELLCWPSYAEMKEAKTGIAPTEEERDTAMLDGLYRVLRDIGASHGIKFTREKLREGLSKMKRAGDFDETHEKVNGEWVRVRHRWSITEAEA
jgi:hypothetical protein